MTPDERRYVDEVFRAFAELPITTGRLGRADRHFASVLHSSGIPIDLVRAALLLGAARRVTGQSPMVARQVPIRSLLYFRGVIEELRLSPPDPAYIGYVRRVLDRALAV